MPSPDPHAEWWTLSDIAAYLGRSIQTVSAYRTRGQMPDSEKQLGRTRLWRPDTIVTWNRNRPGHGGRPRAKRPQTSH